MNVRDQMEEENQENRYCLSRKIPKEIETKEKRKKEKTLRTKPKPN